MYLMIKNPGVADYRAFTLIGASGTRFSNRPGTIGQFGSGSKLSIALLLRLGIRPIIVTGNLKMEFFAKPEQVGGQTLNRVCVKYDGTDLDGKSKTSTDDLGFVLEWGTQDWRKPSMALREFVSNAIDGSIEQGLTYEAVEFDIVNKPRAQRGTTAVFIPYTPEIEAVYRQIGTMFLHFGNKELLNSKILPKRDPNSDKVLIYKKGVLVAHCTGKSVFDYNLGNELTLDESRNANEWDVQYAVSQALKDATPEQLATILKRLTETQGTWEGKLSASYLTEYNPNPARNEAFQTAWKAVAGEKGVVASGSVATASFVKKKGMNPVPLADAHSPWEQVLESYGVATETKVLSKAEKDGREVTEPTPEMIECTKKVWTLLETFNLTNGKPMPSVKAFVSLMDGGTQMLGYYVPGESNIYLHSSLGNGKMMFKVALEECVHYTTGSDDGSRDIQDFLFNMITEMAY